MFRTTALLVALGFGIGEWLGADAAVTSAETAAHSDDCTLTRQDRDPDAAATCGLCHKAIYGEWKDRAHHRAWTDPVYQAALKEREKPELCHSCHIPDSVQRRLGKRPDARARHHDEGVTCVACHKSGDRIAGPFGATTDAHPTQKHPAFTEKGSIGLCASCHDTKIGPVLPLARDFAASGLEREGKSCVGCHMPEVERHLAVSFLTGKPIGPKRKTRSHEVLGPGDPEFCKQAFAVELAADGGDLIVRIANRAGHRVPGLTLRDFPVRVAQLSAADQVLHEDEVVISAENFIKVRETREFRFVRRPRAAKIEVRILHRYQKSETELIRKGRTL